MSTLTLELMGTDHCALCDSALDWLLASPLARGLPLATVDVSVDAERFERYAERVPVLVLRRDGKVLDELDWPFSERSFERFLQHRERLAGDGGDH